PGGGPGGGPGGPGGSGVEIDPLYGLTDTRKPLRSKVLAVPALRAKYLANVKTIAEDALDWKRLGPVVAMYRSLIEKDVQADTRKLESFEAFQRVTADVADPSARGRSIPLRAFADQRRKYLLAYQEPKPK
ncbi:MAG TPA: CotH kinase family protein, partial [Gemmataceae bacterium]|nr:CotH kinase family protein [Gemmataceae bacterium]